MRRFSPRIDRLFWLIWVPTGVLMLLLTVVGAFAPMALVLMLLVDIFVFYFLVSSLVGYVELRERSVFIKYGFILKREIPYASIREVTKERRFYSESMLSLKNAMEHLNIKYNRFDLTCVSVVDNDTLLAELKARMEAEK